MGIAASKIGLASAQPQRQVGKVVWWNGKSIAPENAVTSIFTHSLHYGLGVFEGIRCYKTHDGRQAIFKLKEHTRRLFDSLKIIEQKIPYTEDQINQAIIETVKKSGFKDGCYIRPLVFIGDGPLGVFPGFEPPMEVTIMTWYWGAYLGQEAKEKGARIKISSFTRNAVNSAMTKGKICGQYTTGILAKLEVKRAGYDEALFLDTDGFVSEGSGENIFIVRNGILKTTPLTSILEGLTRNTIIELARSEGLTVQETRFTRDELYCADEAFFTGTAAEMTPIREVDHRTIGNGKPGEIFKKLSAKYSDVILGKNTKYSSWLSYI